MIPQTFKTEPGFLHLISPHVDRRLLVLDAVVALVSPFAEATSICRSG